MAQNHNFNARLHKLPSCPECGAAPNTACVVIPGGSQWREPHNIRQRVAAGDAVVIDANAARAARKLRAVRELAAVIQRKPVEDVLRDVAALKRAWGIK